MDIINSNVSKRFIEILEQLKEGDDNSGTYYAEHSINAKELELSINIEGAGEISFPISSKASQKILSTTEPAKFGMRDKTIYDKKIRDTNEVKADKININYNADKFSSIIEDLKNKLGFSSNVHLKPNLHNILIYSKDQFFADHQDTEKLDGMLATLVMILPSPHIGGALTIKHYGEKKECKSENISSEDIKFIAFYSDCKHEVKKVLDGYRVVVTYNLVAESTSIVAEEEISVILTHKEELKGAMLDALKEGVGSSNIPSIVYLLNHQYTTHGLSWKLLKGADRLRVELIKKVATEADCEILLALIEERETWTTDGGYRYGDDNEGAAPEELIDSEIDVIYAIDIKSNKIKYTQYIKEDSLYYHLPNSEFKPFETEYEGYMGNYGNTVDYWYHRAAVIIWKKSDSSVMHFLNDPSAFVKDLIDNGTDINSQLKKLWPHWSERKCEGIDIKLLLELAILVNDPNIAEKILQYCSSLTMLKGSNNLICKLFTHYGKEWAVKTLESWLANSKSIMYSKKTYNKFEKLVQDFVSNDADGAIINKLIEYQINRIKECDAKVNINKPLSLAKNAKDKINFIIELIEALQIIEDLKTEKNVLDYIISKQELYDPLGLSTLLAKIKEPELYSLLKNHIVSSLLSEITAGVRSQDNWKINAKSECKCEYCKIFNEFMHSESEASKRWPIKQYIRFHIIDMIKNLEVPISYDIETKGSPHKLLLTKSTSIYRNAKARFEAVSVAYKDLYSNVH